MAKKIQKKADIPEALWMKCPGCGETVFSKLVEEGLMVCPDCNYHYTIPVRKRIGL